MKDYYREQPASRHAKMSGIDTEVGYGDAGKVGIPLGIEWAVAFALFPLAALAVGLVTIGIIELAIWMFSFF